MRALKYIRIVLAALVLTGITCVLLFSVLPAGDAAVGGAAPAWLAWLPKAQLLPALLALNVGVVAAILLATFFIGRAYCSVVCPMGIFQDFIIWLHRLVAPKHRFAYRKPMNWLRYVVLALFAAMMLLGMGGIAAMIAPYGAFGRMVTGLFSTGVPLIVAIATLVAIAAFSIVGGRLWCNTFCPVGTLLGTVSRYSLFGVRLDPGKCVGCRKCEHGCKAMCIDIDNKRVDHSRCVDCWNCLSQCKVGALGFGKAIHGNQNTPGTKDARIDPSRRKFIATTAAVGTAMTLGAQEQKMDGGLAVIADKQVPVRKRPVRPAGSRSMSSFGKRCVACQLCVSQCPQKVLRPSTKLETFMQPEMNYSEGYCRTACTRCGDVCPAGAIQPVTKEEKTSISIGYAVVLKENCISCGNCARHCPATAISMVDGLPAVNESRCIGCGQCEYYCPARPMTAIYVEGREVHTEV